MQHPHSPSFMKPFIKMKRVVSISLCPSGFVEDLGKLSPIHCSATNTLQRHHASLTYPDRQIFMTKFPLFQKGFNFLWLFFCMATVYISLDLRIYLDNYSWGNCLWWWKGGFAVPKNCLLCLYIFSVKLCCHRAKGTTQTQILCFQMDSNFSGICCGSEGKNLF